MSAIQDFSFQGKIWLGMRLDSGKPGVLKHVGDAPALQLKLSQDSKKRTESRTGSRVESAKLNGAKTAELSMTLNFFGSAQLALGLYGTAANIDTSTVTGETLPADLVVGDSIQLDHPSVSSLVLTDSAGTPATLTKDTDYTEESLPAGLVTIKSLGAYTQPFKAAYSAGAVTDLTIFTAGAPERYLLLDGINTTVGPDYGKPVLLKLWRASFDPISQLDLISDDFGQLQMGGTVLFDSVNAADSNLGGFGKFTLPSEA